MDDENEIKKIVKEHYGEIAKGKASCCSSGESSCCGEHSTGIIDLSHGYNQAELDNLPEGAALGLGCGNPMSLVEIQKGWRVLDLGSGAGVDVFLVAVKVGPTGFVTGLDMTDEMLAKARHNAEVGGYRNVAFEKGEIEQMPFTDDSFDLVISNCVINLVPDKKKAYQEIRRVLKPGGMFAVADMATRGTLPEEVRKSAEAWAGCIAGALDLEQYLSVTKEAGFVDVEVKFTKEYDFIKTDEYALLSVGLIGRKP
jgi:ubiquinone/menaquinone biosynthesis C-methylase UbiE